LDGERWLVKKPIWCDVVITGEQLSGLESLGMSIPWTADWRLAGTESVDGGIVGGIHLVAATPSAVSPEVYIRAFKSEDDFQQSQGHLWGNIFAATADRTYVFSLTNPSQRPSRLKFESVNPSVGFADDGVQIAQWGLDSRFQAVLKYQGNTVQSGPETAFKNLLSGIAINTF
jgi:hypothetical protein